MQDRQITKIILPVYNKQYILDISKQGIIDYYTYIKKLNASSTHTKVILPIHIESHIDVDDSHALVGIITTSEYELAYTKVSHKIDKILHLRVNNEHTNKIYLIDNTNQQYNLSDICNKLEIMGINEHGNLLFDNLEIKSGHIIPKKRYKKYDYKLLIK